MVKSLVAAAEQLCEAVGAVSFSPPVAFVYNPLDYAREPHHLYLEAWGRAPKQVVFLGMNPGPWGMAQTGIPFGEVETVRGWLGIEAPVGQPARLHPARPVMGFACPRSEVSGRRLWGLFKQRFGNAKEFFEDHFVANYCPLLFLTASGANLTPDKLKKREAGPLLAACDRHLQQLVRLQSPRWVIGVGRFAEACARRSLEGLPVAIGRIPHPSPANPAANRNWDEAVTLHLQTLGIWPRTTRAK